LLVYPCFVEDADHLVSKTYMAGLLLGSIALLLAMLLEVGDAPDFTLFLHYLKDKTVPLLT
jgi:hypothetical protein